MAPYSLADQEPEKRSAGKITLILFVASFFLHLAVVFVIHHYRNPVTWENGGIASYLLAGKGFRIDEPQRLAEPTSIQAPGYPVVLWGFWKLLGQTPAAYLALSMVQCLAVASMVFPMGALSRRWFPGSPAWLAQGIVVIYPLFLWYCTRIHQTAFVMAAHPWLLWVWLECCRRGLLQGIGTGLLTALAGYFQPVLLGLYAIVGAVLLARAVLQSQWKAATGLILAAITVVLCLTPWTIRNYKLHGRLILIKDSMSKEFWIGNNPHATGTGYAPDGGDLGLTFPPKAYTRSASLSEIQMMDALHAEAWVYIKANPGRTARLTALKLLWFWTVAPSSVERSSLGGEALKYRVIDIGYWASIVMLAALGIATSQNPKGEYLAILALYMGFYSCIYGMTHVGQARFRGEIEYIFLFGAASGLSFLLNLVRGRKSAASQTNAG